MRLGTAYMKIGNLEEAGIWFSVLKAASSRYHDDAVYILPILIM